MTASERLTAEERVAARNARADRRFGYTLIPLIIALCVAIGYGVDEHDYWFAGTAFFGAVVLGLACISLITTKAPK